MIYLVLSLLIIIPLQVSAFSVQVSGSQGVEGVRLATDVTLVNATAESPISIMRGQESYEMSCAQQGNIQYCTHIFEEGTLNSGEHTLTFSQEDGIPETFEKTFLVDNKAPTFRNVNATPGNGVLLVKYDVMDTAVGSNPISCAGLQTIEIATESESLFTKTIFGRPCELQDQFPVSVDGLSGTMNFILTATDALGQFKTYQTQEYTIDFKKPEIQDDFTVVFGDLIVTQISAHPEVAPVVNVIVTIDETNLSHVRLDLRDFTQNPLLKDSYKNLTASCISQGLKKKCTVQNIQLNPGKGQLNIPVYAEDGYGNIATKTIQHTFQLTEKQGEVVYFNPVEKHCDDEGLCYAKKGMVEYKISIIGADAGLTPQQITLATSELADFLPLVRAATCIQTINGSWESADCFAYVPVNIEAHNVRRRVVLTHPTTDIMGTALKGKLSSIISIDNEKPINITPLRNSQICPVAGETTKLTINVTDSGSSKLRIVAEPKNITSIEYFEKWCEKTDAGTFACTLSMSGFVSYPELEMVNILVQDLAGNEISIPLEMEVCESESEIEPEFITSITTQKSFSVDRRITSQMPIKLYIPLDFKLKSSIASKINILDIETNGCVGTDLRGGEPYILNEYDFLDQQGISANRGQPILVVPFGGLGTDIDIPPQTSVNCTIKVYQKKGSLRFIKPEQQEFSVEVTTTSLELGTITDATTDKLEDLADEISDLQGKIDSRMKWHKTLQMICDIAGYLTMAADILGMVQSAVYLVFLVARAIFSWNEAIATAIDTAWSTVCSALHEYIGYVTKIWPQGNLSTGIGMFIKIGCIIYSCGVCSPGGIASAITVGVSGVQAMGSSSVSPDPTSSSTNYDSQIFGTNEYQSDLLVRENNARNIAGDNWIINPYKNINYANICICNPGVIYNYNKNKQLLCRQYACVQDTAANGLPTTGCDSAYDVSSCLYYEGAMTKRILFDNIGEGLVDMLISSSPYLIYRAACGSNEKSSLGTRDNCPSKLIDPDNIEIVLCDLLGSALSFKDFEDILNNPYAAGPLEPEGTNFCEGITTAEGAPLV